MFKLFGSNCEIFKDVFEQFYDNIMSNEQLQTFFQKTNITSDIY